MVFNSLLSGRRDVLVAICKTDYISSHSTSLMLANRQSDNTKRAGRLTIDVKSGKVDER